MNSYLASDFFRFLLPGVIYSGQSLSVTSSNSQFIYNVATINGGVLLSFSAMVTASDCEFSWNTANQRGPVFFFTVSSSISLIGSSFSSNKASSYGGVAFMQGHSVISESNCTFSNNIGQYGAVYASLSANLTLSSKGSIYTRNSAIVDGGVLWVGQGGELAWNLSSSSLLRNSAVDGGVICLDEATATIRTDHSTVSSNTASGFGGVVFSTNSKWDVQFQRQSIVTFNSASSSGGVISSDVLSCCSSLLFDKSRILTNSAIQNGGVAFILHQVNIAISNSVLSNNIASLSGGILFVSESSASIVIKNDSIAEQNEARSGSVLFYEAITTNITLRLGIYKSSFFANVGGAIEVTVSQNKSTPEIDVYASNFESNTGSVLTLSGNSIDGTLLESSFSNNTGSVGGAFTMLSCNNITVRSSSFVSNIATADGGAIFISGDWKNVELSNLTIKQNKAAQGGGVFVVGESQMNGIFTLEDSTLVGNVVTSSGGGIALDNVLLGKISSNYFEGNGAVYGSAFYAVGCRSSATENIFIRNIAELGGTAYWENSILANVPIGYGSNSFVNNVAVYGEM